MTFDAKLSTYPSSYKLTWGSKQIGYTHEENQSAVYIPQDRESQKSYKNK